jgi:hypothetical protein
MSCSVPQAIAPELVGWTYEKSGSCYWIRQAETPDELDRAIEERQAEARRYVTAKMNSRSSENDAGAVGVT